MVEKTTKLMSFKEFISEGEVYSLKPTTNRIYGNYILELDPSLTQDQFRAMQKMLQKIPGVTKTVPRGSMSSGYDVGITIQTRGDEEAVKQVIIQKASRFMKKVK